jgi:hypothetical protein
MYLCHRCVAHDLLHLLVSSLHQLFFFPDSNFYAMIYYAFKIQDKEKKKKKKDKIM